jgi:hypothetical protein
MEQVREWRQVAAECRGLLTAAPAELGDTWSILARSREIIEESRILLIEADQILANQWDFTWRHRR